MPRTATAAEVNAHYTAQDCEVRIDDDGHIEFSRDGGQTYLEGRWVSEYRMIDGQVVLA